MTRLKLAAAAALVITAKLAHAEGCNVTIEANDVMQYNTKELSVPASCTDIEVTLRHSGQLKAKVMGHDWVLAKSSDVSGIVTAGMAAGLAHGYLPAGDKRIIAATTVVGGGESATTKFSTGVLVEGASYTFFCTAPGHATVMHGRFIFGDAKRMARTQR
jgi:azurin